MAFTRIALFLKWDSGDKKYAFKAQQTNYHGGVETKTASYSRSSYDASLLAVRAISKRRWTGIIIGQDEATGTAYDGVEYIPYGTIADLALANKATDLQVKSFEDSDYWNAEWRGDFDPGVDWDPIRQWSSIMVMLEEL